MNADKKISAAVFLTLFLAISPPAPCGDFSLSLEARAGLLSRITREHVYEGEKLISRLDWEVKAVPCIDTALGFSWTELYNPQISFNPQISVSHPIIAGQAPYLLRFEITSFIA